MVVDDHAVTYQELEGWAQALARHFLAAGVAQRERVVVVLPNSAALVATAFAVSSVGAVFVLVDPSLGEDELTGVLVAEQPKAVVVDAWVLQSAAVARALAAWRATAPDAVVVDDVPAIARAGRGDAPAGWPPGPRASPDDPAGVFLTSGTGGVPRGVVHTHRSLCSGFEAMKRKLHEFFRGSPLDAARRMLLMLRRYRRQVLRPPWRPRVWLTPVPLSSITGFTFVLQCLLLGQTFVTMRTFHPRRALQLIERHRVSFLALTPTLVDLMLRLRDVDQYDLSSLFVVGLGASPARPELVARARTRFDCAVVVGYGSTELGGGVLATDLLDPVEAQVSTVGRPFPGAEVRIVDDNRREVAAGVVGELACRTPGLMAGYSAGGVAAVDEDGWYYSSDLAVRDGDGLVRVLGRKDDLIIRAGKKVYPSEVERVIAACPHVREAAVVGAPGPRGEDRICAYVVPEPDGTPDVTDIRAACRTQLAAYKAPEAVFLVDALPTTTAQAKVHRAVLRADAQTRLTPHIKEAP